MHTCTKKVNQIWNMEFVQVATCWLSVNMSVTWADCITARHKSSTTWGAEWSSCNVLSKLHPIRSKSVDIWSSKDIEQIWWRVLSSLNRDTFFLAGSTFRLLVILLFRLKRNGRSATDKCASLACPCCRLHCFEISYNMARIILLYTFSTL